MTDKEIKKALECCVYDDYAKCHYDCPYKTNCRHLSKDALDLITSQQAEIEKLKNENFILSQKRANIFEITEAYGRGKSNAVKEFADRLKKDIFNTEYHIDRYYRRSIDKLVKEMVGENNA